MVTRTVREVMQYTAHHPYARSAQDPTAQQTDSPEQLRLMKSTTTPLLPRSRVGLPLHGQRPPITSMVTRSVNEVSMVTRTVREALQYTAHHPYARSA